MGGQTIGEGDTSSEDEEEDPKWKAAIESIAATTVFVAAAVANGRSKTLSARTVEEDGDFRPKPKKLTHAQIKAQKLLDEMVEKTLEFVKYQTHAPQEKSEDEDGGVRLFKRSPVGIVFDHVDEIEGPKKKPNLLPRRGIDKESKQFKKELKSIAVDGLDILAAAREASRKSLARLEAKEATAKAKAKKEEERIAELKRIRGERWLSSVAQEMKINQNSR